jgi:alcohol dehydrogenase
MKFSVTAFDFNPITRVVFDEGLLGRLGEFVLEYGGGRVLLVSDPGVAAAGHVAPAEQAMQDSGLDVFTFIDVEENPTTAHVAAGTAFARGKDIDFIVGLGGGSSMDCAKGINFVYTNGGAMEDYWGLDKAQRDMLPMIAIPTTAGTGSECQSFALIANKDTHQKMACGDKKSACRVALLDPGLTLSQPAGVTIATGLDAISHAVETCATTSRNAESTMFSHEAGRHLFRGFPAVLRDRGDLEARAEMQIGASLAGAAIENSMLGAAHACANPLTARFGVVHGIAVATMLPHVVRFNAAVSVSEYEQLCEAVGWGTTGSESAGEVLAAGLEQVMREAGVARCLKDHGVTSDAIDTLAEEAAAQWTAGFNPRPVTTDDFRELYQDAM